jgi:hypothetical protein
MVDKFKKLKDGKALCDRAEKAAKANGAAGLTLKIEPPENLPPDAEAASDLQHGQIGIRDDLSDAKMLESIIIELSNIARTSALDALDKDITKMTRDAYIEAVERVEFQSVKDTAAIWKAVAKEFGQDPADCPTYGNTDDVANLDFKTFFDQVRRSHKEFNGRKWDDANST